VKNVLIVTPARNEAKNLPNLAKSLSDQSFLPVLAWIIVDDGSSDGTESLVTRFELEFDVILVKRQKIGKLITGAAFAAWWQGVDSNPKFFEEADFIMKLDADVILDIDYFKHIFESLKMSEVGVVGGVISDLHREQKVYVPGPVKMYSKAAIDVIRDLPIATGFDVMDEILCKESGLNVQVIPTAKFRMGRQIGHSQGLLHGRYRNGLVCRWIGYAPEYFVIHLLRYLFRVPYIFGSIWMVFGYLRAGKGPYSIQLRNAHKLMQRQRLSRLIKNPIKTLRELYF